MPVTSTDAVLHYDVGIFGELGYAIPNPSDDIGSLNHNIIDLTHLIGRNLFTIMHHQDVDLRVPPSINTLRRVHKLYIRSAQILAGRAVPPNELNMETAHVNPGGEVFKVWPVPFHYVRNMYLKRWAHLMMTALSEAMQHTENRKAIEISTDFAGQIGQYMTRVYANMAVELFGKTRDEVRTEGFLLTEEELLSYDPTQWFTSTEMVDTVPRLDRVITDDGLFVVSEGVYVTSLADLKPFPVNMSLYRDNNVNDTNSPLFGGGSVGPGTGPSGAYGGTGGSGSTSVGGGPTAFHMPPPPGP